MRAGHGGAVEAHRARAHAQRKNVIARRCQIHIAAKVGKRCTLVRRSGSRHCNGIGVRCRVKGSAVAVVARSCHHHHPARHGMVHRLLLRSRKAGRTEAEVDHFCTVVSSINNGCGSCAVGAAPACTQYFQRHHARAPADAGDVAAVVAQRSRNARHMRAVPFVILRAVIPVYKIAARHPQGLQGARALAGRHAEQLAGREGRAQGQQRGQHPAAQVDGAQGQDHAGDRDQDAGTCLGCRHGGPQLVSTRPNRRSRR